MSIFVQKKTDISCSNTTEMDECKFIPRFNRLKLLILPYNQIIHLSSKSSNSHKRSMKSSNIKKYFNKAYRSIRPKSY